MAAALVFFLIAAICVGIALCLHGGSRPPAEPQERFTAGPPLDPDGFEA